MKRSEWLFIVEALIYYASTGGPMERYTKALALAQRIQSQLDNPIVVREDI